MSSQHQGRIKIAQLSDFHGFAQSSSIIDVRSPAEFADDHIPGALNCPVLDNAQRIEVGTLYQQHSPFAAKKIGGVFAYGGEDPFDSGCVNALRCLQDICSYTGATWVPAVYGCAHEAGEVANNAALLQKAEEYGASF